MLRKFFNWLIPLTCLLCQFPSPRRICMACFSELPWILRPCLLCAKEIPTDYDLMLCGTCLINPPPINRNVTLFHYDYPIVSLITGMKFQYKLSHAKALGFLLAERINELYIEKHLALPECIIPVPLHKSRLNKRGYNQALEIAKPIKKLHQIPIDFVCVQRKSPTNPQTLIKADKRRENVRGAFVVASSFKAKYVAVVDDVLTTFSTLTEIANVLRQQGVEQIDVWCLAKAS